MTLFQVARATLAALWTAVRYLAAPVLSLSAISVVLVVVLHDLNGYDHGTALPFGAWALWGGLVCVTALVLLLAGLSLGLTPLSDNQRVSFNGTVPASLVLGILWVFISVVSATLWPLGRALDSVKLPAHGLTLGPLLLVNLVLTTVFVGALMLLVMISGGIGRRRATGHRLVMASLLLTVAALGAVAALTGADPLMHWLGQLG